MKKRERDYRSLSEEELRAMARHAHGQEPLPTQRAVARGSRFGKPLLQLLPDSRLVGEMLQLFR